MSLLINALTPQITAQEERLEAEVLWTAGVFLDDADAFKVTHDTGFNLAVGSGSAGDRCIVPGINRLGGKYPVLHDLGTATVTMTAADGSLNRIDLVGVQVRDDAFDSSGFSDVKFVSVEGVPSGTPVQPASPAGFLLLATVLRVAAEGAVTPGNIADKRVEAHVKGTFVETVVFTGTGNFVKADYPWLRAVRVRAQGGGGGGGGAGTNNTAAGGGGSGGYAEDLILASALATSETVTGGAGGIGGAAGNNDGAAGGDSSFGAHAGGGGGGGGETASGSAAGSGGLGGAPTAGGLQVRGDMGINGSSIVAVAGGNGGSGKLGSGGIGGDTGGSSRNGTFGQQGGGGGGGSRRTVHASGGDGGTGIVIVELYA